MAIGKEARPLPAAPLDTMPLMFGTAFGAQLLSVAASLGMTLLTLTAAVG